MNLEVSSAVDPWCPITEKIVIVVVPTLSGQKRLRLREISESVLFGGNVQGDREQSV